MNDKKIKREGGVTDFRFELGVEYRAVVVELDTLGGCTLGLFVWVGVGLEHLDMSRYFFHFSS
jgi:hypothetical protein